MKKIILSIALILAIALVNTSYAAEDNEKPSVIIDKGTGYVKTENLDDLDRSFNIKDYLDEGMDASKDAIDEFFLDKEVEKNVGLIRGFINKIKEFFEGIAKFFKNLFFKESKDEFINNIKETAEEKANEKVNDTLSKVDEFSKNNLDKTTSSYVSSIIENAKNISDEDKNKNINEVTNIITDAVKDIKTITEIGNSNKAIDTLQSLFN